MLGPQAIKKFTAYNWRYSHANFGPYKVLQLLCYMHIIRHCMYHVYASIQQSAPPSPNMATSLTGTTLCMHKNSDTDFWPCSERWLLNGVSAHKEIEGCNNGFIQWNLAIKTTYGAATKWS